MPPKEPPQGRPKGRPVPAGRVVGDNRPTGIRALMGRKPGQKNEKKGTDEPLVLADIVCDCVGPSYECLECLAGFCTCMCGGLGLQFCCCYGVQKPDCCQVCLSGLMFELTSPCLYGIVGACCTGLRTMHWMED